MAHEIEELFSLDHLYLAFLRARKAHPMRYATLCFEEHLVRNLREIRQQILAGTYQFGPYRCFVVHDNRMRHVVNAPFCDRVVHHVLYDLLASFHTGTEFDALFPSGHPYLECHAKGLPLGNLTSQILANIYLDPFDHWIKDELGWRYYVRYVDDSVFWHSDRQQLLGLRSVIDDYLRQHFGLLLRPNKTALFPKGQG